MSIISRNIFLTIVFILILFTPPIRFLPYYTWILSLLGLCTLFNHKFRYAIGFNSNANRSVLNFLALIIIFNCVIVPFNHFFEDFTYIPLQIGIILTLLRSILLIYCLYKYGTGDIMHQYSKYFIISCCIYVSFTLLFIISPDFKELWLYSILEDVKDRSDEFIVYQFRYSIDGFAAFSSATVFSFACLYNCYLIASSRKIKIYQIASLILIVVGCFFYGRVSLVGMLLGLVLIVWSSGNTKKALKILILLIIFIFAMLAILNVASQKNEYLVMWQDWAFSIVKQLFVEKKVTDFSVTHMVEDMYYMPDFFTFLFGDGKYTNPDGSYYGHTDVGFMRLILYGGVLGLLLIYSFLIYLSKMIFHLSKSKKFKKFIMLALILFFILEMKGECYQRAIMMLYPLFIIQQYKGKTAIYENKY